VRLADELTAVTAVLAESGIDYALCGGLALAVYGHPRSTQDLDLLIQNGDVDRVVGLVRTIGFDFESGWITFRAGTSEEMRLFRLLKTEGTDSMTLDLMIVTPVLEAVWQERRAIETASGKLLNVVSREGLIRMKELAGRIQDLADIDKLRSNES